MTPVLLTSLAAPYRRQLLLISAAAILSSLASLLLPWLAGQLLGGLVNASDMTAGTTLLLLLVALSIVALFTLVASLVSAATTARILADLQVQVYAHIQKLPHSYLDNSSDGDLLALMTSEVSILSNFIATTLASTPARLLTAIGSCLIMLQIEPRLAFVAILLVPLFYGAHKVAGRRLRDLGQRRQIAEAGVIQRATENLGMLPAIKAFSREDTELARYRARSEAARELRVSEARIFAVLGPIMSLCAGISAVLFIYFAGRGVQEGTLTEEQLFSLLFYAALLTRPLASLAHLYGQYQLSGGILGRMQSILSLAHEPGYSAPVRRSQIRGQIVFDGVHFAYLDRTPVFHGLTLSIDPGETVALVGPNGAGKSTLTALLMRGYDPQGGRILVDGLDITTIQVQSLRRMIGHVPQVPLLFNGTIRENIAFGKEGANDAEIEEAARLARVSDFVHALPRQYDTRIGDRGILLSGGQRQKIALARALVKDPPILILDEATSMFDEESEASFLRDIELALARRTVIWITHRAACLDLADRIVQLEAGDIGEIQIVRDLGP